jgi:hypothetical protein
MNSFVIDLTCRVYAKVVALRSFNPKPVGVGGLVWVLAIK